MSFGSLLQKAVVAVLLGLLLLSFSIWGVGDLFRGGSSNFAAKVGDEYISKEELGRIEQLQLQGISGRIGRELTPEQKAELRGRILDDLITQNLLAETAAKAGIEAGDEQIKSLLIKSPQFADKEGKFSREKFLEILEKMGMSEKSFMEKVQKDVALTIYLRSMAAATPEMADIAAEMGRSDMEKRVSSAILIPKSAIKSPAKPDDAATKAYYDKNIEKYKIPELRKVSALLIQPNTAKLDVKIEDAELQKNYEEKKAEFHQPETNELQQIFFADQAKADEAYAKLKKGEKFEDVAENFAKQKKDTTELGAISKADLASGGIIPADVVESIIATPVGQFTAPVKTQFGVQIFKIVKKNPEKTLSFEEALPILKESLKQQKISEGFQGIATKLTDAVAGGAKIEELKEKFGGEIKTHGGFTKEGRDNAGELIKDLPLFPDFLTKAFELKQDVLSVPMTPESGSAYMVMKVDEITAEKTKEISEIKTEIEKAITDGQIEEAHGKLADGLYEEISKIKDADIQKIAKEKNYSFVNYPSASRSDMNKAIPGEIMPFVFTARVGDISKPIPLQSGSIALVRVNKAEQGSPDEISKRAEMIGKFLQEQWKDDLVISLMEYARQNTRVKKY